MAVEDGSFKVSALKICFKNTLIINTLEGGSGGSGQGLSFSGMGVRSGILAVFILNRKTSRINRSVCGQTHQSDYDWTNQELQR